jgi:hypothetical protein
MSVAFSASGEEVKTSPLIALIQLISADIFQSPWRRSRPRLRWVKERPFRAA